MLTLTCDKCEATEEFADPRDLVDKANRSFWRLWREFNDESEVIGETLFCPSCFWSFKNSTLRKCARCACSIIDEFSAKALSRTTRDEGAAVMICTRCGERESLHGRDPAQHVPLVDWPVPVEDLVEEERLLLTRERMSRLALIALDELTDEEEGGADA